MQKSTAVRWEHSAAHQTQKSPANRAFLLMLAERTGLADILPAADSLASEPQSCMAAAFGRREAVLREIPASLPSSPKPCSPQGEHSGNYEHRNEKSPASRAFL
jgi:hypothetical protein